LLELAAAVPMKPVLVRAPTCCGVCVCSDCRFWLFYWLSMSKFDTGLEALGVGQALHSFFWWGDRPEAQMTVEELET